MNAEDSILERTLAEVRREKRRRRVRAVAALHAVVLTLAAGIWLASRPVAPVEVPLAVKSDREEPAAGTIAVLVIRDGGASLQEFGSEELVGLELRFSLDPVVARCEDWD